MKDFTINNKKILIYESNTENKPIIYLNNYIDESNTIYKLIKDTYHEDFTLVSISNLNWNYDMVPWNTPPIFKNGDSYTGGADEYLTFLTQKIIPAVEKNLSKSIAWRGIVGYSLSGLFAIYSLYKIDLFSRCASVSGSLWFPNFKEFIFSHEMKTIPKYLYFSLGDKEAKSRNQFLKKVELNTKEIEQFYRAKKINTVFQLNSGNHYHNSAQRTAVAIKWLLNE